MAYAADKQASGLTAITPPLAGADLILVQPGAAGDLKKATLTELEAYFTVGGAGDLGFLATGDDAALSSLVIDSNLTINGTTISTISGNASITLDPHGNGNVLIASGGLAFAPFDANGASLVVEAPYLAAKNGAFAGYKSLLSQGLSAHNGTEIVAALGAVAGFEALYLGSGVPIKVSSTTLATGTADLGQIRHSPGVWRDTNGSTGIGARLSAVLVEAVTAGSGSPNILVENESGTLYTNEGAVAEVYITLPAAVAGKSLRFGGHVQAAQYLRFTAGAADTIRAGTAAASAAAGFIRSNTQGATIWLHCINATEWVTESIVGTWLTDA